MGSIPGLGRSPGGGHGNPLQYFLPGKFHGQRSLAGYSPWGCEAQDLTERTQVVVVTLLLNCFYYMVPLRSQGYCGVGRGLSGLHWVWCNGRGPHFELMQERQVSSTFLTPIARSLQSWRGSHCGGFSCCRRSSEKSVLHN